MPYDTISPARCKEHPNYIIDEYGYCVRCYQEIQENIKTKKQPQLEKTMDDEKTTIAKLIVSLNPIIASLQTFNTEAHDEQTYAAWQFLKKGKDCLQQKLGQLASDDILRELVK